VRALSPDGTKAVFKSYDKGQNLAVYDVASQQTTLLTNIDQKTTFVDSPAWSHDGRRIAYGQCAVPFGSDCEVRVATLAGESQVIFRSSSGSPGPAGWLPDGSAIVVTLVRPDNTLSIGLVPTAVGALTPLRSISGWPGYYPNPVSVSPDGRLIAFAEGALGTRDIHVIGSDGRTAHHVTDHPADDHRPLWSPDGRHLAFLSTRNGSAALWTVAIRNGQPAAEPVRVKDGMQDAIDLLGWTARGLAFLERVRADDIYTVLVDPASGEPSGSPRQIPYQRTGRNASPAWSPDGRYLAFGSSSPGEPDRRAIVVLPSGGGEAREFPIPTNQWPVSGDGPNDLRWFGDSRGLGFTGLDARGEHTLFRLTLATGTWKTFPHSDINATRIEWNADGNRYFYAQHDLNGDDLAIAERDPLSNRERIVFHGKARKFGERYRGLQFSPDRRFLAFRAGQQIRVLDIETGQTRVVYEEAGGETIRLGIPTWSPNGRALLVDRIENPGTGKQAMDLRLVPLDGGEARRIPLGAELTRLLSSSRGATIGSVVWSPDGGRLAFVLRARRLETSVLENPLALAGAADGSARK
jgi:Tol biopolymer transport system component